MKKYYLNDELIIKPKFLIYKGCTVLNPSDKILLSAGYEIREEEEVVPPVTNETIKRQRLLAYRMKADQYFIAYQAYTELGETDKANGMKELWIKERELIDKQYPYIEE